MKLVIDIPDKMYEQIMHGYVPLGLSKYLMNSTPLEKHDEEVIKETVESIWGKPPYTELLDKIRADIEKAMEDFYYDEHDLGVRAGFRFALEIIDNHIRGKEQE